MEPPGTAPGSDPLITSAFMSIVPKDIPYIGELQGRCNPGLSLHEFNNYCWLGGFIHVDKDQPQGQNQLDSTKSQRLEQRRVIECHGHETSQSGPGIDHA